MCHVCVPGCLMRYGSSRGALCVSLCNVKNGCVECVRLAVLCMQLQCKCVCACVCVYTLSLSSGSGGPHGRGREFLGTRPLTVKHFRGCPSKNLMTSADRAWILGFFPPPTPTVVKHCMFGMQNMNPADTSGNMELTHKPETTAANTTKCSELF